MKTKETSIPAAYITIDETLYLVTSGPITYIMKQRYYPNGGQGWIDDNPPDEHMEIIRSEVKRLWGVLI